MQVNILRSAFLQAALSLFYGVAFAQAKLCPIVHVKDGALRGSCDAKVASYKGIPYAKPPIGDLRWRPPQPPLTWQGVKAATAFSASCIQDLGRERLPWSKPFMVQNDMSEDCLTLNVWAPRDDMKAKHPVYVFIHGGGFVEGSSEVAVYDGHNLSSRGVVVVTINYRLGILGLLAHPALSAESPHHASGNYGILDAVSALHWVQDNISQFGGDPRRVTIGGQSAGSRVVHVLSATPMARGLFENAIAESGSTVATAPDVTLAQEEKVGVEIASRLSANSLADLRKLPASELVPSHIAVAGSPALRLTVNTDGWILPEDISNIFAHGKENKVNWITGMQADEGSSGSTYAKLSPDEFAKQAQSRFNEMAQRFLALYPPQDPDSQRQSARDRGMISMYLWVQEIKKTSRKTVYTYYFNEPTPWPEHPEFATFHTSEIPFDLDNLEKADHPYSNTDRAISHQMVEYWSHFMSTGNPNVKGQPEWRPVDSMPETMELGPHPGMRPLMNAEKLAFWTDYFNSPPSKNTPTF